MHQFSDTHERMSDDEAQEVMRILAERQRRHEDLLAQPSVRDVAAVANTSEEDVRSALAEVRREQFFVERKATYQRGPWPVAIAALTLGILLMVMIAGMVVTTAPVEATSGLSEPITLDTPMPPPLPDRSIHIQVN